MTRPDFTDWLRGRESPETEWRPQGLKGAIDMHGTGELLDWVGQGYGDVSTTELLEAVEAACRKRGWDAHEILILAYKSGRAPYPWEVRTDIMFHPSSDDDQVTIYFQPIKEGV